VYKQTDYIGIDGKLCETQSDENACDTYVLVGEMFKESRVEGKFSASKLTFCLTTDYLVIVCKDKIICIR
jgi:hypothetical protein